ncbi:MAG: PAS domain-containing protein [Myxococcaceae bacterium]|nr:PAS domain-containing protein [Myxococcaceae bacterium]
MTALWSSGGAELAWALHHAHPDGCLVFESVRDEQRRLLDFRFVHLNPAGERLVRELGAAPSVLGRGGSGLIDFDACVRVVETGEPHTRELLDPRSGRTSHLKATVVRHGDGFALWLTDLGDSRRDERELTRALAGERAARAQVEAALAADEALFDDAPVGLALLDAELTPRRLNRALAALEGLTLQRDTHRPPEGVEPTFVRFLAEPCRRALATHRPCTAQLSPEPWTALRPGGVWQVVCFPVHLSGRLIGVGVSVVDVSERVQAESAMRSREEHLRLALEAAGMVAWEWSRETRTVSWSAGAERFFGLPPGTLGTTLEGFVSLVHPEDRKAVAGHIRRALEGDGEYAFLYRHVRPAGEVRYHEVTGRTQRGSAGRVTRMLGVVADCTEREQAAAELRLAEERYRLVAHVTRDVVWDWNLTTGTISWNEAAEWMLGYRPLPGQMDYRWWEEHVHPLDRTRVVESMRRAVEGDSAVWREEYRFLRADGIYLTLLDRGYLVRDTEGRALRMISSMMDITSLKRAEEEKAREAEFRERFIGILGHDLRTPLNAISLSAQALRRRGPLGDKQRDMVNRIQSSTQRMERMITEILDLTRARLAGGIPVFRRECNLHLVCRQVVLETRAAWPERNIRFETEGLAQGEWDSERLTQALTNLVSNACQHSPEDSAITVRCYDAGERQVVEVHNVGEPIAPELLPTLFEAFRQGPTTRGQSRPTSGLGLGLFIVREILRAHGGTVDVRSTLHGGTTFSMVLPRFAPVATDPTDPSPTGRGKG